MGVEEIKERRRKVRKLEEKRKDGRWLELK